MGGRETGKKGASSVNVLETERLNLRRLMAGDAAFILELKVTSGAE
jgi:hypothetical protein